MGHNVSIGDRNYICPELDRHGLLGCMTTWPGRENLMVWFFFPLSKGKGDVS